VSALLRSGAPEPDAFYDPPEEVPAQAGVLLRVEPFDRALPDGARGWRFLYTTTREDGVSAVASGIVALAQPSGPDPLPVVTWAHGTTGADVRCAPSLLEDPFEAGAMFLVEDVVEQGWALVATDYVGLGTEAPHPYLVGEPAGRAVLDSVRAARQLPDLALSDDTVVWGHSQGGGAALWAGVLATDYAPDAGVLGVAALAPASDLPGLVANLDVVPGGGMFASYVVEGYTETYDDVDAGDYVRPGASVVVDELASRCLAERQVAVSVLETLLVDGPLLSRPLTEGPFGQRLEENVPTGDIDVPLLVGQGAADQLVLPEAQQAYVDRRCADGGEVDYRTYEGLDHVPLVEADSPLVPELLAWTQDRLDGRPATSTC
jgi:alpha-beta hydrolase superfamily lysophospholipase